MVVVKWPLRVDSTDFNAIEVHQADFRLANTRFEFNADGNATGTRNARGGNEAATIFVRGSQPIIVGNDFRNNAGATISINANALTEVQRMVMLVDRQGIG